MAIHNKVKQLYVNAYSGIRSEVWWLSLIMLINRSGAMVFPFMSIYLTHHLHFTEIQAGWILSSYGMGSMVGVLAGGWLADKYGSFIVQFISQILSGIGWLLLSQVTMYEQLIFLVFFQSMISDAFRPANNSSVTAFTDFHNRTKSFSLNRMAMNMGYTVGPAIGGIFATISYTWLFWGDGMSCIISAFFFIFLFRRHFFDKDKKSQENNANQLLKQSNPLKDSLFLCFTGCTILFGTLFFQLLFTLPVYYANIYKINEAYIGTLLAINGFFVFFTEMTFVYLIGNRINHQKLIVVGIVVTGISFYMLNWIIHPAWLILSMVVISVGEIMTMPFIQTYVANRAPQGGLGRYLAFYSFAYSVSLIIAPLIGMWTIKTYGFTILWDGAMVIAVITALLFYILFKIDNAKKMQLASTKNEEPIH